MLIPNFEVFLAQLVTFAIGMGAVWVIYLKPLGQHLRERKQGIVKDLANADAARAEAEALRAQLVKERAAMADELKQAKDAAKADVAKLREELLAKAKHDQEALLKSGRAQIQAETLDAIAKVRDYAAVLVVEATAKMLDKKLDAKADQALAQKLLDSVKVKASKN